MRTSKYCIPLIIAILCFDAASGQQVSFSFPDGCIRQGDKITFINTSDPSLAGETFIWNFGESCGNSIVYQREKCDMAVSGKQKMTHLFSAPGKFRVSLSIKHLNIEYSRDIYVEPERTAISLKNMSNNLIANGDFETCRAVPSYPGQLSYAAAWYSMAPATADLFHRGFDTSLIYDFSMTIPQNFAGYADEYGGKNCYAGIIAHIEETGLIPADTNNNYFNYREYIVQEMPASLLAGKKYSFRCKARLSSLSRYASRLGIYYTDDVSNLNSYDCWALQPQMDLGFVTDTGEWVQLCDTMIASGSEKYLVIGCFQKDSIDLFPCNIISSYYGNFASYAAYYYLDDIRLSMIDSLSMTACAIVSMGHSFSSEAFMVDHSVGQVISRTFMTHDTVAYLTQGILQPEYSQQNKYQQSQSDFSVSLYPNPANDHVFVEVTSETPSPYYVLRLFDSWGKLCDSRRQSVAPDGQSAGFSYNIAGQQSGLYILQVTDYLKRSVFVRIIKIKG